MCTDTNNNITNGTRNLQDLNMPRHTVLERPGMLIDTTLTSSLKRNEHKCTKYRSPKRLFKNLTFNVLFNLARQHTLRPECTCQNIPHQSDSHQCNVASTSDKGAPRGPTFPYARGFSKWRGENHKRLCQFHTSDLSGKDGRHEGSPVCFLNHCGSSLCCRSVYTFWA